MWILSFGVFFGGGGLQSCLSILRMVPLSTIFVVNIITKLKLLLLDGKIGRLWSPLVAFRIQVSLATMKLIV